MRSFVYQGLPSRVVFGATVELADCDTGDEVTYQIVGDLEADIKKGLVSVSSPLARALIGGTGVDNADYSASAGRSNANLATGVTLGGDAGGDTLTSIENLIGTNSALSDFLTGNAGVNRIEGGAGNDEINGGLGEDTVVGGLGADRFIFDTAPGSANVDTILDFATDEDLFQLDNSVFTGLVDGTLAASAFVIGTAATDALHRIIYDDSTGDVLFDNDGDGANAAVRFASLDTGLSLDNADFMVV